jgi:hypothetical protein
MDDVFSSFLVIEGKKEVEDDVDVARMWWGHDF